MPRIVIFMDLF